MLGYQTCIPMRGRAILTLMLRTLVGHTWHRSYKLAISGQGCPGLITELFIGIGKLGEECVMPVPVSGRACGQHWLCTPPGENPGLLHVPQPSVDRGMDGWIEYTHRNRPTVAKSLHCWWFIDFHFRWWLDAFLSLRIGLSIYIELSIFQTQFISIYQRILLDIVLLR